MRIYDESKIDLFVLFVTTDTYMQRIRRMHDKTGTGGVTYTDRPTMTFSPVTGAMLAGSFVRPLAPREVLLPAQNSRHSHRIQAETPLRPMSRFSRPPLSRLAEPIA